MLFMHAITAKHCDFKVMTLIADIDIITFEKAIQIVNA